MVSNAIDRLSIVVPTGEPTEEPRAHLPDTEPPGKAAPSETKRRRGRPRTLSRAAGKADATQPDRPTARRRRQLTRVGAEVHQFRVELLIEAQDIRDALRQAGSLSPLQIVSITREM